MRLLFATTFMHMHCYPNRVLSCLSYTVVIGGIIGLLRFAKAHSHAAQQAQAGSRPPALHSLPACMLPGFFACSHVLSALTSLAARGAGLDVRLSQTLWMKQESVAAMTCTARQLDQVRCVFMLPLQ